MALVTVLSNKQLDEQAKKEQPLVPPQPVLSELAAYVRKRWESAARAKIPIKDKMLASLRAFKSEYDPTKLQNIKAMQGSEVFNSLTATKCNAAIAWIKDILFQPNERPWGIEPTPEPELPDEVKEKVMNNVFLTALSSIQSLAALDPNFTPEKVESFMAEIMPKIKEKIKMELYKTAKEYTDDISTTIADQLEEGGWYTAISECVFDFVLYKAAILKGPVVRKEKTLRRDFNPTLQKYSYTVEEKEMYKFNRISPFNIYPSPDSSGENDSYIIEKTAYTPRQLGDLIGLSGFDSKAIRRILDQYKEGGLRNWTLTDDAAIRQVETGEQTSIFDSDKIDAIIFHGSIPGKYLLDWGIPIEGIPDSSKHYDACVYLINGEIIKAMLNYDPLGDSPYSVASYIEIPGSFWGSDLPELITDLQVICNALTRAVVNNSALSSGPMVEWDGERFPQGQDTSIYPWKSIVASNSNMSSNPAVRFYQPQLTANALLQVLDFFIKLADQFSIPSFAHGDTQVGGGGSTASGLSMLMGAANKIIKNAIKNFDCLIVGSIRKLYIFDAYYNKFKSQIGDIRVIARGSSAMLIREQQTVRILDFMNNLNNPTDLQILGIEGRKNLVSAVAKQLGLKDNIPELDPLKDFLDKLALSVQASRGVGVERASPTQGAIPSPRGGALDLAGNRASGQDNRVFLQNQTEQVRS